jgi:hypothetical protein
LYLLLLLLVLVAIDIYVVRALKHEFLDAAFSQLDALSRLALEDRSGLLHEADHQKWVDRFGISGVRATIISGDGKVLADSSEDPTEMGNHLARPERLRPSGAKEPDSRAGSCLPREEVRIRERNDQSTEALLAALPP